MSVDLTDQELVIKRLKRTIEGLGGFVRFLMVKGQASQRMVMILLQQAGDQQGQPPQQQPQQPRRNRVEDQLRALLADKAEQECAICLCPHRPELSDQHHAEFMMFVGRCGHALHLKCLHEMRDGMISAATTNPATTLFAEARCPVCRDGISALMKTLQSVDPDAPDTAFTVEDLGIALRNNEAELAVRNQQRLDAADASVTVAKGPARWKGNCKRCFGPFMKGDEVALHADAPRNSYVHPECLSSDGVEPPFTCMYCEAVIKKAEKMYSSPANKMLACDPCATANKWTAATAASNSRACSAAAKRAVDETKARQRSKTKRARK